ncbi:MAG: serine/threonine protein kinase, partial [Planctomycetaceae bacterium]|nr:serine/threonine protein kinase [Planctomycetaceae bacterium]
MPQTLNDIADRLAASGLLSVGEIATLLAGVPGVRPETPEQFIQTLLTRGALTAYQAECILGGRIEHLVLGNYVVLDKLGQGGMGLVLKARHRRMDRIVALKLLSPDAIRTPTTAERFQREARAAAKLAHPNIVTAFDADEHHGAHFLVMEYVEGRDLSSLVKEHGPLTVATAIDCILQAAVGLEYAHRNGVVHRDIKPGNLMVCCSAFRRSDEMAPPEGGTTNVKILDMGLASIEGVPGAAVDHQLTSTGAVLGTIDYMSPEQALDTKQADARSDIYSLGCTLFYLLTSQTPYSGDTVMKRLLAHRDRPIPDLTAVRRDVPSDLHAVFSKMVAKQPEDRFQTMTDVVRTLTSIRAGLGGSTTEELLSSCLAIAASAESSTCHQFDAGALSSSQLPPT